MLGRLASEAFIALIRTGPPRPLEAVRPLSPKGYGNRQRFSSITRRDCVWPGARGPRGLHMTESFGARLRQQRERQQIALTDIADRTKINRSLLDGLERDDLSNWPAGIFRRSFIRAYAQAIGLEPGSIVREFLELCPDPAEEVVSASPSTEGESFSQRPPTRLSCLIGSAISSLRRSRFPGVQESV